MVAWLRAQRAGEEGVVELTTAMILVVNVYHTKDGMTDGVLSLA